ncbi:glutamate decarboxylase 5-like [Humulus lupulus]|uniref:glutamate decarboxylase 5-like n=1 Tax=Humulus lupulus TaxID=3486 RepID=UPI002B40E816|nr:glutamate decarboxylase 5-like [Humulus lupulus]
MVLSITQSGDGMDDLMDVPYASRYDLRQLPKWRIPDETMPKEVVYQFISDELKLDGTPLLDVGSFINTSMEPECDKLIMASLNMNFVNMIQNPVTTELQERCVNMIARLFNAPSVVEEGNNTEPAAGVGTIGSSEAAMLAGLAFKRKWQHKGEGNGKPNIVIGANLQVCWEKFANYFEVELRKVDLKVGYYVMDPKRAVEMVDQNTICVVAILGSTLTGEFEDVRSLNELLTEKNKKTGWDTPIHVDAASGGFVAPFLYPDIEWDFKLPLVKSINVSGHKYGLVYPGVGWVVWRTQNDLPTDLIFEVNYLGTKQPSFTLNFSKGSSQIIAQYYQFMRLGIEGYTKVMTNCMDNARALRTEIEETGHFFTLSRDIGVPLVAFSLSVAREYTESDISDNLRMFGWIVPAYAMPGDLETIKVLRLVIREDFSRGLVDKFISDLKEVLNKLNGRIDDPALCSTGVC